MNHLTESFLQIEATFHEALEAPEDAREALIAARCNGDPGLIAEVHALLAACEAEEQITTWRRDMPEPEALSGTGRKRIGPYQVDRLLGRGGMGAVYLAHRADGQFEQQVAIKLIDLPLATDLFRERFRQERQILAGLQHPYIARLLDGGVTSEGDLYLAMEYVDGVPIHRFCETRQLSIVQRLHLFLSVCEAVQFAHQNLVVHRDLKPDNIFVAEDGTPRLLDFGTAKLLSPSLANPGAELTREGFQSFTPQYASPEQVLGGPITTASDAYSLGVLLYLLLTGTLPYELKELTTAEMLRVICEEPPRKPAHAIGSTRRLDPDLEAILSKALRKEPEKRYPSAERLGADVRAHLYGHPVGARRGTLRYRAGKLFLRHPFRIAGAIVLALTLAGGVAGVLWQARVANEERRRAEARSADLRQLSNSLLSELDEAIKQLPGSTGVQKLLVTRVLEHLDRMARDAQGDRLTQIDLVDAYTRLGNIQGNPYEQNLADPAGALASIGKALSVAASASPADRNDRDFLRALATAQQSRAEVLFGIGKTADAVQSMRAATGSYDLLIAPPDSPPNLLGEAAAAYGSLGDELGQSGTASLADSAGALAAYRKAIDLDHRALAVDPAFPRALRGLAIMQMKIGGVELETDPASALNDFRVALERADALPKAQQGGFAATRMHVMLIRKEANTLVELGQYNEAVPLFEEAIRIHQQFAAEDPDDQRALADLEVIFEDAALCYEDAAIPTLAGPGNDRRQDLVAADKFLKQAESIMEKLRKRDPANENWRAVQANAQVRIGRIQQLLHEPGDPEPEMKKALAVLRELASQDQASPMVLDQAVRAFLRMPDASLNDPPFAVRCAERGVALTHGKAPSWLLSLAEAEHASGALIKAREAAREGLALLPPLPAGAAKPRVRKLLELEAKAGL